jgi:hypothetical protein
VGHIVKIKLAIGGLLMLGAILAWGKSVTGDGGTASRTGYFKSSNGDRVMAYQAAVPSSDLAGSTLNRWQNNHGGDLHA